MCYERGRGSFIGECRTMQAIEEGKKEALVPIGGARGVVVYLGMFEFRG